MANTKELQKSCNFIDLTLAEEMINKYNGDMKNLQVFIDNCNKVYNLLDPAFEIAFVAVVLSKIDENIRSSLLNNSFTSWNNLRNCLLENYAEKYTFAQGQLQLNSCWQRHDEPVLHYSNRIENCFNKLVNSLDSKLDESARRSNIEFLKNQALVTFIRGLIPQLQVRLKSEKPITFGEAVTIAVSEEKVAIKSTLFVDQPFFWFI